MGRFAAAGCSGVGSCTGAGRSLGMRCSIGGIRREFMDRFAVACCGLPIPSTPRCAGASAWPDMGRLHQRSCLIIGAFWLVLPGTVWASPPDMEVLLTGTVENDARDRKSVV